MKARYVLMVLAVAALSFAACSDDDPVAPPAKPAFNTSKMPITIPNVPTRGNWGAIAFDGSGNLLVPTDYGVLHSVSRSTGQLGIVAANVGMGSGGPYDLMSCVYDAAAERIYVGQAAGGTRIYSIDPIDGSSSLLADLGSIGTAQELLMAPSGFGSFGGQLIVVTNGGSGGIVAVDPSSPGSPTTVSSQNATSGAFGPDGTLYVTDYQVGRVVTISAVGDVAEFATGIPNPEGVAVNSAGSMMYIASAPVSAVPDSIYTVTIPGGVVAGLAEAVFNPGYWPTGITIDGAKLLYLHENGGGQTVDYLDL